jgi:F0F1-type ATP synthase membrane subunit b/b'
MITSHALIAAVAIDVDITAVIMAGLFLVLYFVLQPLIINPYLRAREARDEGVDGARQEAADFEARAEATIQEYEEAMVKARRKAQAEREAIRDEGVAVQHEKLEEARAEVSAKLDEERAKIGDEAEAARKELEKRADALSRAMVEKVLPNAG